jgi:hypothetical protein
LASERLNLVFAGLSADSAVEALAAAAAEAGKRAGEADRSLGYTLERDSREGLESWMRTYDADKRLLGALDDDVRAVVHGAAYAAYSEAMAAVTPFERVMAERRRVWEEALDSPNPAVRRFAARAVLGPGGFAARACAAYTSAKHRPERDRIRAVYGLLLREDCALLGAFETPALYWALAPYFAAEFRATGLFAPGWQELAKVTPRFLARGFARMARLS